ncbi:MAG: hypothetical protein ABR606_10095 [Vicinamibacterales bacterium]
MTSDWMPVIGISVALMALVQVAAIVAITIALRRLQTGVQSMERKVDSLVAEVRPQIARVVEDARAASASAHELLTDMRHRLEQMEAAADSVRKRVSRVVDGVQYVANNLPGPVKVSGPAAMAAWAGLRVIRTALGQMRERRRERHIRDRQLQEAETYIGV